MNIDNCLFTAIGRICIALHASANVMIIGEKSVIFAFFKSQFTVLLH